MGVFDSIFGKDKNSEKEKYMEFRKKAVAEDKVPSDTIKTTPDFVKARPEDLEKDYIYDGLVRNGIKKITQIIMNAGHTFDGSTESVDFAKDFTENIGYRGGETDWYSLLEMAFKFQMVYGEAWWEKLYDADGKLADLDYIDPKSMSYAMTSEGRIAVDSSGKPLGYVQTIKNFYSSVPQKYEIPKGVVLKGSQIFLPPNKVVHFKFDVVGDGFVPIGLIEPIHDIIKQKKILEQLHSTSLQKHGRAMLDVSVGDETHDPTDETLEQVGKAAKDATVKSLFVHRDFVETKLLEPKNAGSIDSLNYHNDSIVAGLGIPESFITGKGETTNRATLGRQEYILKITIKDLIKKTLWTIQSQVFYPLMKQEGLEDIPKIIWGEVSLEEADSKAERLAKYASAGILRPDAKLEESIRITENLPAYDESNGFSKPAEPAGKKDVDPSYPEP